MDFGFGGGNNKAPRFQRVEGTITDIMPAGGAGGRPGGCGMLVSVDTDDGQTVNMKVVPSTYVVDFETLSTGMRCIFWYPADAPAILIYPPQYTAAAAAEYKSGRMIDVSYYGAGMVNAERTLKLNLDASVEIRTTNEQYYMGSPANNDLLVIYGNSTRSVPAQTTPEKIVVLCG